MTAHRAYTKHGDHVHLADGAAGTWCHRRFDRWADTFLDRRPVDCRHCLRAFASHVEFQQRILTGEV